MKSHLKTRQDGRPCEKEASLQLFAHDHPFGVLKTAKRTAFLSSGAPDLKRRDVPESISLQFGRVVQRQSAVTCAPSQQYRDAVNRYSDSVLTRIGRCNPGFRSGCTGISSVLHSATDAIEVVSHDDSAAISVR